MTAGAEEPGKAGAGSEPESAAPEGNPHRARHAEALRHVRDADEVMGTGPREPGLGGTTGGHTLSALLRLHVFMSFFCWVADRQFPASHRPETRVSRLREADPRFYWICVSLDVVVGLVAVAVLVGAAASVLYKSIWL